MIFWLFAVLVLCIAFDSAVPFICVVVGTLLVRTVFSFQRANRVIRDVQQSKPIHDTYGKVYPICHCRGCEQERAYVAKRQSPGPRPPGIPQSIWYRWPEVSEATRVGEAAKLPDYVTDQWWGPHETTPMGGIVPTISTWPKETPVPVKLHNPTPPPIHGTCKGCNLDVMFDPRMPSCLCEPCVDLELIKHHNLVTWGLGRDTPSRPRYAGTVETWR